MALTSFQRTVCALIARNRIASGESYIAGGVALNQVLGAPRLSNDIDLFHDTDQALEATWDADRALLKEQGFRIDTLRERPSFIEARVSRGADAVLMQWVRDSAFRFFPLVEHEDFGLTLHPFDHATNKLLALIGRREVRDWVDILECDARLQPLGYLAWAGCGKDPGFSPLAILEEVGRAGRYSAEEVATLGFDGPPPDPGVLSRQWHAAIETARRIVPLLPPEHAGTCVLSGQGTLYLGTARELEVALAEGEIRFHPGRIRGAFPQLSRES